MALHRHRGADQEFRRLPRAARHRHRRSRRSEFVTFLGPSGCGKTTTLRTSGGLPRARRRLDHGRRRGAFVAAGRRAAGAAAHGHGLPELRRVAAHVGVGERGVRPALRQFDGATRNRGSLGYWRRSAWRAWRTGIPVSSAAASSSAWPWRARWSSSPQSCCSTSRSPISTPSSASACAPS